MSRAGKKTPDFPVRRNKNMKNSVIRKKGTKDVKSRKETPGYPGKKKQEHEK